MRKNNGTNRLLVLFAITAQRISFQTFGYPLPGLPFANGLELVENYNSSWLLILFSYFPIPFILFEFWGRGRKLTEGYGKVLLIRSYKRSRLCIQTIVHILLELAGITAVQILIFSIGELGWHMLTNEEMLKTIAAYYAGLGALILLQFYLEMFGESDYSNIAVNIYFIVSIFTGEALIRLKGAKRLLVLLFPNFMFGRRNGALAVGDINIKFAYAMAALIITSLLFGILSVLKFQKKDIY